MLSDYLRSKADWRRRQKKEFPNDARNEKSAVALESLAEYVEGPAVSDIRLERLSPHLFDDDTLGGERTWRAVSRYGYANIVVEDHHPAFLDELAALCQLDAYTYAREHGGEDRSGTLFDFELDAAREDVELPRRYFEFRLHSSQEELKEAMARYREEGIEPRPKAPGLRDG